MRKRVPTGFTLIEVMFLTIVIAVISLAGLKAMTARHKANDIQKAAYEIQNIQQAALAYYATEGHWPEQGLIDLISSDVATIDGYLPRSAYCSPFSLSGSNGKCGSHTPYEINYETGKDYKTSKFAMVSVTLGSEDVAEQLASQLPSSTVDTSSSTKITVTSTIALPGMGVGALDQNSLIIKQIAMQYFCQTEKDPEKKYEDCSGITNRVKVPHCPYAPDGTQWKPKIQVGQSLILNQGGGWFDVTNDFTVMPIRWVVANGTKDGVDQDSCGHRGDPGKGYTDDLEKSFEKVTISGEKYWKVYACTHPHEVGYISTSTNKATDSYAGVLLVITYCQPPDYNAGNPYPS